MYHVCRIKRAACPVAVFEFFSDPVLYLRRLALEGFHKFDDLDGYSEFDEIDDIKEYSSSGLGRTTQPGVRASDASSRFSAS